MRLTKIKLAGFKSFVDPTILHLPSQLVAIVGPNGCGKSNIIDAVRWVMGESSVRSLRGETMTDVIFSGAAQRKPVGQASIELVFDNQQGRLGGPWASYAEIAIKRVVSRDGQSNYFLNGSRCRRRDIADIFLGTGLGPRSYAIIEQGMISRVVQAKPEELRIFLEEAAGISKYKERRRETESRMRHTRENLERLTALRDELGRQLQHLERQARAAEQYRHYRAEERRLKAELLTVRWRNLQRQAHIEQQALREQETALEAIFAEQRRGEVSLEQIRLRRIERNDAHSDIQSRYYQTSAEISRLEQYLEHQQQLQRRWQEDWRQLTTTLTQLDAQAAQDRQQQQHWLQRLAIAEPALIDALANETEAQTLFTAADTAFGFEQATWDTFIQGYSENQRLLDVERTRLEHLKNQIGQGERHLERLRRDQEQLAATALDQRQTELEQLERQLAETLALRQQQLREGQADLVATRDTLRQRDHQLRLLREQLHAERGRFTSLQTLQEAALRRDDQELNDWLDTQGLAAAPRLAEQIEVKPGWEEAVETVLADWLNAICVPSLETVATAVSEWRYGSLALLEMPVLQASSGSESTPDVLLSQLDASWPVADLLKGVGTAANWVDAWARRPQLGHLEQLVTPEGLLLGRHWLRWARGESGGVLRREREIRQLQIQLQADENAVAEQSAQAEQLRTQLHEVLEQHLRVLQQETNQGHGDHARVQGELRSVRERTEQARVRTDALIEEQLEMQEQQHFEREQLAQARLRLEELALAQQRLEDQKAGLLARREQRHYERQAAQQQLDVSRRQIAEHKTTIETLRTQLTATEQAIQRLDVQRQQALSQQQRLEQEQRAQVTDALSLAQEELAHWLDVQVAVEAELQAARQALNTEEAKLQAAEQARSTCQERAERQRQSVEVRRLVVNEAYVRQQGLLEQLQQLGSDLTTVLSTLPDHDERDESVWLVQLEQLERRIQRLGPINLAAVEECAQLLERKQYLDAQNADLLAALEMLENAIHKIDQETRSRFRETFDRVNAGLGNLFPRLFGGGQAQLELVGNEILDAGVAIVAKPPGKRVGAISLLSGGEKALTAVALIFAIFQLNPAPFCLLDEVDAPLDEANVRRFGDLVQEMSKQVQFVFVTHNKATMEIAQHLMGVTMQEPGVSRLVAVDVEAAAQLAVAG
jgi:chromosome segregation protein